MGCKKSLLQELSTVSKLTGYKVFETGLWVNSKYPHLGASPDGLVVDENSGAVAGIMEAKCLKILRNKTVEELILECHKGSASDILKNQCFSLGCGKLCLKKCHSYLLSSTTPTVNN